MPVHPSVIRATILALGLAAMVASANAQSAGTVRGRVTESSTGRPISDAQITVVGTRLGAISDRAGEFAISSVPAGAQTLRARMIGFSAASNTVTVADGQAATAELVLSPAAIELDQVVITGTAGESEKRTLGNSVTQLDVADLTSKASLSSVTDVLQSRTPGLTLLPGSGTTGTAADLRIRGAGSLVTSTRPVFYVDGVRYSTDTRGNFNPSGAGTGGVFSQGTSVLDAIDPQDIESIEVIKGPAAATLYGTDAAGGVIQIITKKGSRGQQTIRWSARAEVGQTEWALDKPVNVTTCDSVKQATPVTWPGCAGQLRGTVLRDNPLERDGTALRAGDILKFGISARGGGDRHSFYVSGQSDEEQGVFYNNYSTRRSLRTNFNFTPLDQLEFGLNLAYAHSRVRLPLNDDAGSGLIISAVRGQPGRDYPNEPGYSILGPRLANRYDNQTRNDRITLGSTVHYRPFTWLRNRVTLGLDYNTGIANVFYAPDPRSDLPDGLTAQSVPMTQLFTADYSGTVARALPRSFTSATSVGVQLTAEKFRQTNATGTGLGSPINPNIGSAAVTTSSSSFRDQNQLGYYIQEQIGWENRLFVTGAIRADNNSAFGEDYNSAFYPKAQVSYVVSEEPALRRVLSSLRTDELRLRFAWGQSGKSPGPFDAARTYIVDKVTLASGLTGNAIRTSSFGNPNLKPERGEEFELGFDAAFFDNRLGVEFTYYDKVMRDALIGLPNPPSSGFIGSQLTNLAEVANSGLELVLSATPVQTRAIGWDSRLTLSTNENELVRFGFKRDPIKFGIYFPGTQQHREGYPIAGYWGQSVLRNADGSVRLSPAGAVLTDTAVYIGPSVPAREAGFSNTFTLFRNWRVYTQLDYKGGHYLFNVKDWVRSYRFQNTPELNDPNVPADRQLVLRTQAATTGWIQRADFIKLRDISVSYTLPAMLTRSIGAGPATITLAGHNLSLLWTRYGGADPEVNFYGRQSFERSDSYTTPMTRRLTASLNLAY